jgi:putative sugar O-methyltransferase
MIFNYVLNKFKYWIKNKIFFFKLKNFILRIFVIYFKIPLTYIFIKKKKFKSIDSGFNDFRNNKNHIKIEIKLIKRILNFYNLNKKLISKDNNKGVWKEWIDLNFTNLIINIEKNNINKISLILNNMFREKIAIGAGGYDLWNRYNKIFGKYYINLVWNNYFEILKKSEFPIENFNFPLIGNPCGIEFKNSVIPIETLRHTYFAQKISKYISKENANVVDIGPGIGGVIYQLLNLKKNTKVFLVDLPEMIFFSAAFITTAFPDKKVYFYGETEEIRKKAQIFFVPNNQKNFLENYDIDIYFNSCSFSEMDSEETYHYLEIINKNCKGYLIHDNHEDHFHYKGSNNSKNVIGSNIGQYLDNFELIEKRKRTHRLPDDLNIKHFEYVYKRF